MHTIAKIFIILIFCGIAELLQARTEEVRGANSEIVQFKNEILARNKAFFERRERRILESKVDDSDRQKVIADRLRRSQQLDGHRNNFVAQLKRYSSEENEKRDRNDEERLYQRSLKFVDEQRKFAAGTKERRLLQAHENRVDPLLEFEIDMKKDPEMRSSWSEVKKFEIKGEQP